MAAGRPPPRLLLVTGMSGAGKSSVLDALEDMGWDCVDNLPVSLLHSFAAGDGTDCRLVPAAVAMDVRSRGFDPATVRESLASLPGVQPEILFLDSATRELIRRYDETRRRHPLALDRPAEDGIARERAVLAPLRAASASLIDTTELSPVELREELRRRYGQDSDETILTIASFGFARGILRTADLVFDLRFLPNPHWVDELRPQTGADSAVRDFLAADPSWAPSMDRIEALLSGWIPGYWAAGKSYLTVAFGCTGGRHRSVAAAIEMAERLRSQGFSPNIRHRDLASSPSDPIEGRPGPAPDGETRNELEE
ncbi:MAG TPA: RNase adapter RapZ [Sphingomicrobium sp.]|nr:RNase adapter RapZ [Sphingomicrobium sp.]